MRKPTSGTAPAGVVRLISGQWRGRKLPVLSQHDLRPTSDRVRETLFNWLAPSIAQARVLDVFAGSGSLGFEALSRYAAHATLCEKSRPVAAQLKKNKAMLNCDDADIICKDALTFLSQGCKAPFDIVFLDPPFRQNLVAPCVEALMQHGWLRDGALVYIEQEQEAQPLVMESQWHLEKEKVAGQTRYQLWRYRS